MDAAVMSRVLTIEEVKQKMKDIRAAAVHYGGVVHCGERGKDELVIVSSRRWEEMTRGQNETASARPNPYAAFSRALQDGRLGVARAEPVQRRRIPGLQTDSGVPVEQMSALGAEDVPSRRRPADR
jgi:hypothetical protein